MSSADSTMTLILRVWRQAAASATGSFVEYRMDGVSPDMSFLEMLDVLNDRLTMRGEDPIAFDSDCREGICGTCGFMINGSPHGPERLTTVCQLHMRHFRDGDTLTLEPWRSTSLPVLKDLVVDRSAFDRIIAAGGYISVNTGAAPEAHAMPVPKENADLAFSAAECIGCAACVAACPNGSAMLFTAAKVAHLAQMPQGQPERSARTASMLQQHDAEGFGACSNVGECSDACPKGIQLWTIGLLNADSLSTALRGRRRSG